MFSRPGMQNLLSSIQSGASDLRHVSISLAESRRLANSASATGGGGLLSMLANVMADRRYAMTDGACEGDEEDESDDDEWNDSDED
jgi:hypothetical protein